MPQGSGARTRISGLQADSGLSSGALHSLNGGSGGALDAALAYSNIVFAGAILLWVFNTLASILRGTGNMIVPAVVICAGTLFLVPLSPCLIFGLGPLPRLVSPAAGQPSLLTT